MILFPSFAIYVISMVGETNRAPFDLAEAEGELVGGFHTEYSSLKFALFFLAEYVNIVAVSALATTLFMGGYHALPGLTFTESWLGQTDSLERDGCNHGECCAFIVNRIGNPGAKILGYTDNLGMGAVGDHAVAGLEFGDAGAGFENDAGIGVAESDGLVELRLNGFDSREQTVGSDLIKHHAYFVGLLAGFFEPIGFAEVEEHALGSGRDERLT